MTALRLVQQPGVTLDGLTRFIQAAEAGSLSRAATRARVAQSTVSRAIARLEAAVQLTLFHRSGRAFSLTEAGAALLPAAHEAVGTLESFNQAAAQARGDAAGSVRLSLCHSLGRHVLLPALLRWAQARPSLSLDVRFEERDVDPRAERLDVVVRAGRSPDREVMRSLLGSYGHVLVAAPKWIERHGRPIAPEALTQLPTVALRLERVWSTWLFSTRDGEPRTVRVTPQLTVTDADALVDAACAGAGATVLPDYLAAAPLKQRQLVRLCGVFSLPRIPVVAQHAPARRMPLLAREALQVLRGALDQGQ
jgi:DNA-binding transcriptional LysR family regulator